MRQIALGGHEVFFESDHDADVAIVNTCGFIADAKEESVDVILSLIEARKRGRYGKVIVFGCLSQRYLQDLKKELPEVDHFFGVSDQENILRTLNTLYHGSNTHERMLATASHYAYLKISEGCNRKCSFCIIPSIRGKHLSVPADQLIREAEYLSSLGVKELLLVAQDLSSYGVDFRQQGALAELLKELEKIAGIEWIRLHYAYPAGFPEEIIDIMANSTKILNYLDIPFQHSSDRILKAMHRGHTADESQRLINRLRSNIPGIAIRTTLISGFPTETEIEHQQLLQFVKRNRFERLGVFTYSEEEGTEASEMIDNVPVEVKERRRDEILKIQEQISSENNNALIGKFLDVIIDRVEDGDATGRTRHDSPEVDQEVFISGAAGKKPGDITTVLIEDAEPFELFGAIMKE